MDNTARRGGVRMHHREQRHKASKRLRSGRRKSFAAKPRGASQAWSPLPRRTSADAHATHAHKNTRYATRTPYRPAEKTRSVSLNGSAQVATLCFRNSDASVILVRHFL